MTNIHITIITFSNIKEQFTKTRFIESPNREWNRIPDRHNNSNEIFFLAFSSEEIP